MTTRRGGGWGGADVVMDGVDILDNAGGVLIAGVGSRDVGWTDGAITSNTYGLSAGGDLVLDAVDLGVGSTDNTEFDVRTSGADTFYDGVTSLTCTAGTCTSP